MRKFIISAVTSSFLMVNTSSAFMPVFDAQALIQDTMSYVQDTQALVNQIKDMMMFDKQLAAMGIDLSQINGFINQLQGTWEEINSLKDQLGEMTDINKLFQDLQGDCLSFENASDSFKNLLQERENAFKKFLDGADSKMKACAELMNDDKAINLVADEINHKAQQCLINDDLQCYQEEREKEENIRIQQDNAKIKQNANSVNAVLNEYTAFKKGVKGKESLQKQWRDRQEKLNKEMTNLYSKDEKKQREAGIQVQKLMLDIMLEQYELMQNTSNMFATIYSTQLEMIERKKLEEREPMKELENKKYDFSTEKEYKKDAFGLPKFGS